VQKRKRNTPFARFIVWAAGDELADYVRMKWRADGVANSTAVSDRIIREGQEELARRRIYGPPYVSDDGPPESQRP